MPKPGGRRALPRDKDLARVRDGRRLPRVEVTWIDSSSSHGWDTLAGLRQERLVECRTVGYLVRNSRDRLNVVQSFSEWGKGSETWVIPRANIRRVRRLR